MTTKAEHALLRDVAQIATLRIPDTQRIAEICARLHQWAPIVTNSFLWFNRQTQVTNFYLDKPEFLPASHAYIERYFGTPIEQQFWTPSPQLMARGPLVDSTDDYGAKWTASPMYRDIFSPQGIPHMTRLVIARPGEAGRGGLGIHSERPLRPSDRQTLRRLIPYVNHALDGAPRPADPDLAPAPSDLRLEAGEPGIVLLDQRGEIVQTNEAARHLIHLACHEQLFKPGDRSAQPRHNFHEIVRLLCRRLANPAMDELTNLPELSLDNVAGHFHFRAERLSPGSSHPEGWICITITRQLPLPLLWHRAIDRLSLSPVEKHVSLLLLENASQPAIAAALKISLHTVVTHVRNLYRKLGVTDRAGLSLVVLRQLADR